MTGVSQAQVPGPKGKEEWGYVQLSVWSHQLWRGIYREKSPGLWGNTTDSISRSPPPIHAHSLHTSHLLNPDQFNIIGREDQNLSRLIKDSIYITVNNPTLNRNIAKFNLSHLWDRVLFSPLTLKQPFHKGMYTYAHSYYINCSYVGLSSDLKKSTVVDESLSVFKPMICYENTLNLFYVIKVITDYMHVY